MTTTERHQHVTTITINKKYQIEVVGPRLTGLEIKEAAIAQGVPIKLDFQLSEILPSGGHKIIGNDDEVTINQTSQFIATADDDNSSGSI